MRQWMNENSGLATGIAAVVLLGALGALAYSMGGGGGRTPTPQDAFYVDLETGERFIAPAWGDERPSPEEGVLAIMYGCGGCVEGELILGHYEHHIPPDEEEPGMTDGDLTQVSPDGERWYSWDDPRRERVAAQPRCDDGEPAQRCLPRDLRQ